MIKVVGREGLQTEISESITVENLLKKLGLKEQGYVCIRNGTPVTRFDSIEPDDEVILMEIFSGG